MITLGAKTIPTDALLGELLTPIDLLKDDVDVVSAEVVIHGAAGHIETYKPETAIDGPLLQISPSYPYTSALMPEERLADLLPYMTSIQVERGRLRLLGPDIREKVRQKLVELDQRGEWAHARRVHLAFVSQQPVLRRINGELRAAERCARWYDARRGTYKWLLRFTVQATPDISKEITFQLHAENIFVGLTNVRDEAEERAVDDEVLRVSAAWLVRCLSKWHVAPSVSNVRAFVDIEGTTALSEFFRSHVERLLQQ